ncbi:hypothetical protein FACS1894116_03650 [Betaproteobacteria bacterium]|nr:hypothetical protein FACS1894116_03650 [Betaproteobacteria bacterium]GHU25357.1 hypothetical protein FACS189488_12200 [Betaproteobacteria bacterium]GHU29210.1 hypothetical protein FACS189497_06720 [Betaproteobacteria bacterium]
MRFDVLDGAAVINTIEADPAFMLTHFPAGNYRAVDEPDAAPEPESEPPPANPRLLTTFRFRQRFSKAEKVTLYTLAKSTPLIQVFLDDVMSCPEIDLDDPDTAGGVRELEALGILAAGRAGEILG